MYKYIIYDTRCSIWSVVYCTFPHTEKKNRKNLYSSHPPSLFVETILLKDFIIFYIIYYDNVVVKIVDIDMWKIVDRWCRSSQLVNVVNSLQEMMVIKYVHMKFILFKMLKFIFSVCENAIRSCVFSRQAQKKKGKKIKK